MFLEDDDLFGGSVQKKYFDIIFNANRNLVEYQLTTNLERIAALELLIDEGENLDQILRKLSIEKSDEIAKSLEDLYITGMGDIVSQNE